MQTIQMISQSAEAQMIIERVSWFTEQDIMQRTKKRDVVEARQIAMYIILEKHILTQREISELFDMNHSTVAHAIKTVRDLLDTDTTFKLKYNNLIQVSLNQKYYG